MSDPELRARLAGTVAALRHERGLTVRELAERAGVSSGTISKIEHATMSATIDTLAAVAQGLDVGLGDVLADVAERRGSMRARYSVTAGPWSAMARDLLGQVVADIGDRKRAAAELGLTAVKLAAYLRG